MVFADGSGGEDGTECDGDSQEEPTSDQAHRDGLVAVRAVVQTRQPWMRKITFVKMVTRDGCYKRLVQEDENHFCKDGY